MAEPIKRFSTSPTTQEPARRPGPSESGEAKPQGWAAAAAEKVEGARESVGGGVESLADKIRDKGPHSGMLGKASGAVADQLESAGSYLREHSFKDMGNDITNLIRRYPIGSLLVGLGVGFLLARGLRS